MFHVSVVLLRCDIARQLLLLGADLSVPSELGVLPLDMPKPDRNARPMYCFRREAYIATEEFLRRGGEGYQISRDAICASRGVVIGEAERLSVVYDYENSTSRW
jgi:hypothetical protein